MSSATHGTFFWDVMQHNFVGTVLGVICQNTVTSTLAAMTTSVLTLVLKLCSLYSFFRYASLYFCCAIEQKDNELLTLEIIHRYVELLDKYFGSVSIH